MSDKRLTRERIAQLTPKRLTLLALELQEQLDTERRRGREPVAIVGMACRFPGGANSPEKLWALLDEGRDVIAEVPPERWDIDAFYDANPDAPGKMSTRFGGFIDAIDQFDADLFGISPREAESMDPQQRLLLELSWEALERAGIAPDGLRGTDAGVFVGICNTDYAQLALRRPRELIDAYFASGAAFSVAAGRVAYVFGLEGATMVIDTACSSSLVAIHEACSHLNAGSVSLAIAAGVNVICAPDTTIALSKAHMMAPDGRCKTFDDSADGFVRAEGCGVLVLKRLQDAVRDGDRIHAVIRGSAVNQDGRSSGLTVPSGSAQVRVIRDALANAGLEPTAVDYVEAHGTGTSLGDPIELRALGEALCGARDATRPLLVGSVKTNLGHLESAAGVAGIIKAVLAMEHGAIPPHLHFSKPNHDVAWSQLPIRVVANKTEWPRADARVAGVSSFGFSGTNAHVLLSGPPRSAPAADAPIPTRLLLPIAAKTQAALQELTRRYGDAIEREEAADVCYTAAVGRAHLRERVAAVGESAATLRESLRGARLLNARPAARRAAADVEPVFVFTGSGSQWLGMAMRLYATAPVFRAAFDECARVLEPHLDVPLLDVISVNDDRLRRTRYAQPAVFAIEYSLVALWRSWGVAPAAVIGHSLGEYVAACVAGVFTLAEALSLVADRARLIDDLPSGGAMAAVLAPFDRVRAILERHPAIEVAAMNSPANFTIAGESGAVDAVLDELNGHSIEARRLAVTSAFHSAQLDPMLDEFERRAARVAASAIQIPLIGNLTGRLWEQERPDAAYWRAHARRPVQFAEGVRTLLERGYRWFVEIGPHPVLSPLIQQCAGDRGDLLCVPSLRRGFDDWQPMLESLGTLYVHGATVDWAALHAPYRRRRAAAPTYPFEHKRYWLGSAASAAAAAMPAGTPVANAPLLAARLAVPIPTFATHLTPTTHPFAYEHRVNGVALAAVPLFVEVALEAAAAVRGRAAGLKNLVIKAPLELAASGTTLHTTVDELAGDSVVRIYARAKDGDVSWTLHAETTCGALPTAALAPVAPQRLAELGYVERSAAELYDRFRQSGIDLGPAVAGIRRVFVGRDGDVVASIDVAEQATSVPYVINPACADAVLQAVGAVMTLGPGPQAPRYLLAGVKSVAAVSAVGATVWCRARVAPEQGGRRHADVVVYDDTGATLATMTDIALVRAPAEPRAHSGDTLAGLGYVVEWRPQPIAPSLEHVDAGAALQSTEPMRAAVERTYGDVERRLELGRYDGALADIDALARRFILAAFDELGVTQRLHLAPSTLRRELGIVPRHERLFARLFEILVEGGYLEVVGEGHRATGVGPPAVTPDFVAHEHPECRAEVAVLARCGARLADVLRGQVDPVALLFAEGAARSLEALYREAPFARAMSETLAAALSALIESHPPSAPLRILEIGAGTGGTTSVLLPLLVGRRVSYRYTDLSTAFLDKAAREFAQYPFVSYSLFDVEKDAESQSVAPGAFDIVIAANVIHATSDVAASLRHARELLAPGGALLLVEGTTREPWVDLTFGLTEGWWRFTDTKRRPSYPLLDRPAWSAVLAEAGFVEPTVTPAVADGRRGRSQILVSARTPMAAHASARRRRQWLIGGGGDVAASLLSALPEARRLDGSESAVATAPAQVETIAIFAADSTGDAAAVAASALAFVQTVARAAPDGCRVWFATVGAVPFENEAPHAALATLWGLGRGLALEQPERWGGLVDLDPKATRAESVKSLLEQIDGDAEDQIALRNGRRYVARLVAAPIPAAGTFAPDPAATYLVTGGLGGLGLALASWLVDAGARHLVLLARTPLPARSSGDARWEQVDALARDGVTVEVALADVADRDALQRVLDDIDRGGAPLRGVFHCAAAVSSVELATMAREELHEALRAKVTGTELLDELTRARPIDVFVLFSSTTALLGVRGLAHYAAANQYLDAFAHVRRSRGVPALSINWGTWELMRVASAEDRQAFARGGLLPLSASAAFEALGRLIANGSTQHTVAAVDWPRLKSLYEARRARPLLALVDGAAARPAVAAAEPPRPALAQRLATLDALARRGALVEEIRKAVADVLRLDASRLRDLREGFFDLGMDSLMAVELRNRLETLFGLSLPSTLTFNYPNIEAVAEFIDARVLAGTKDTRPGDARPAAVPPTGVPAPAPTADKASESVETRLAAKLKALGYE